MSGTRNVGGRVSAGIYTSGGRAYPNVVSDTPFNAETPNGIARSTVTDSAGYGNRRQVDWAAKGRGNRSGE